MTKCYNINVETKSCYGKKETFFGPILFTGDDMFEGLVLDGSNERCFVFGKVEGDLIDLVISHMGDEKTPRILCLQRNPICDENEVITDMFFDGMNYGINKSNYSIDGDGSLTVFNPMDHCNIEADDIDRIGLMTDEFKRYNLGAKTMKYYDDMRTVLGGGHK